MDGAIDGTTRAINKGEEFERYRVLLFSIAYRMTGSASDAEDLAQETWLRYQASADQEIVSPKAYLTTITTHLALDYLKSARVTREQYFGTWLPEPILTAEDSEAILERQEELSLAFLHLLERLSPPERAVFLLHEVFEYPFGEIGPMLEKSPSNCRQIFHRAKQALQDQRARFHPEPQRQRQLLLGFLSASQAGNMDALTGMLAQDAITWADGGGKVQTVPRPIYGQQAVARFWLGVARKGPRLLTYSAEEINGEPAMLFWDEGQLYGVLSLTVSAAGIQDICALLNPEKLTYLQKQLSRRETAPADATPLDSQSPDHP
jgi:RNA polymerase sigma-70 factor (ECF subfamily)